ncbi:MAG: alpha/beta fold hydrolase [Dehalococcoidia bacterium]|nr:alpha/beta fold hydrolase [Dehalococcoidia bacterium]
MVSISTHNTIQLPDGRSLGYAEFGDPDGFPVLFFHGVPGSRLSALLAGVLAAPRGGRVIALDRPGYGLSDWQPKRRITDWPADVEVFADALGLDEFALFGYSGGAPYAEVCAVAMPERVTTMVIVSGMGPIASREARRVLSRREYMTWRMVRHISPVVSRLLRRMDESVRMDPGAFLASRVGTSCPADAAILGRPEVAAMVKQDLAEAFVNGPAAASRDVSLLAAPWGFDLRDVAVPTHLWHGEADTVVPAWLGRITAEAIPGTRSTFVADAGHLLLIDRMEAILDAAIPESARTHVRERRPARARPRAAAVGAPVAAAEAPKRQRRWRVPPVTRSPGPASPPAPLAPN